MSTTSRKIFNWDNIQESKIVESLANKKYLYENSISACGCLFYKIINNKVKLLLISYESKDWPKLDDFGGRIDNTDESLSITIARETSEETNNIISYEYMMSILKNEQKYFYNKQSKYYVALIETNDDFHSDTEKFGNIELHDNIKRSVKWCDYETVKNDLAMRLLCNIDLINFLDNLNNNLNI